MLNSESRFRAPKHLLHWLSSRKVSDEPCRKVMVLLAAVYEHDQRVQKTVEVLVAAEYDVTVVALSSAGVHEGRIGCWTASSGSTVHQVKVGRRYEGEGVLPRVANLLLKYAPAYARMFYVALSERSYIVHANDAETLPLAVILKGSRRTRRVIYDAHEYSPHLSSRGSLLASLSPLWKWIIVASQRWVDHLITVSPELEKQYGHFGFRPTTLVRNVPRLPDGPVSRIAVPSQFSYRNPLRCVYLGSMYPGRGVETAIEAVGLLHASEVPVHLTLVGEARPNSYRRYIEELADSVGAAVELKPLVAARDVPVAYSKHHLGLVLLDMIPEHMVYLPNKLFEIMMAGLAVVGTKLPDIESLVHQHVSGLTFDGTPEGLADTLRTLIADPSAVTQMQAASLKAAQTELNWNKESGKLLAVYDSVSK